MKKIIDGRTVSFFSCGAENVHAVFAPVFEGDGSEVLSECEKIGAPPFNFVTISCASWDADLSPWKIGKVFSKNDDFEGKASDFAEWICDKILPLSESVFGAPSFRVVGGYSMAGLFSVFAPTVCDKFDRIVSASGSLWFPDFVKYIEETQFKSKITKIYLSLGDREKITKNKLMKNVQACTENLFEIFKTRGIDSVFELNPGNHFQDSALRLAKGIKWAIDE